MAAEVPKCFLLIFCFAIHSIQNLPWTSSQERQNTNQNIKKGICQKKIDLVVVLDSSGSTQNYWNDTVDLAQELLSYFEIRDNLTRVGILDVSQVANVYQHLDTNNSNEEAYKGLEALRLRPQNGQTVWEAGFEMVLKVLESASPIREDSKKAVIFFTDQNLDMLGGEEHMLFMDAMCSSDITLFFLNVTNNCQVTTKTKEDCSKQKNETNPPGIKDIALDALQEDRDSKPPSNEVYEAQNKLINGTSKDQNHVVYYMNQPSQSDSVNTSFQERYVSPTIKLVIEKEASLWSHNYVRALHGVPALEWNDEIANAASKHAYQMALRNKLEHSTNNDYGENLYYFSGSISNVHAYKAVLSWYSNIQNYDYKKPGYYYKTGTFTQVVWKNSQKIGVGLAFRPDIKATFIAAFYSPYGNMNGDFEKNVLKPLAGLPARIPELKELIPPSSRLVLPVMKDEQKATVISSKWWNQEKCIKGIVNKICDLGNEDLA